MSIDMSDAYLRAQTALDEILGPEEEDGSGEGLVGDIWLIAKQRDEARETVRAYEAIAQRVRAYLADEEIVDPIGFLETLEIWLNEVVASPDAAEVQG